MRDTSPSALTIQIAAIRGMTPVERLDLAFEHSEAMRDLALAGLRARHPDRSERELVESLINQSISLS